MPLVWSTCPWLCALRSFSSACRTCPTWTPCTSTHWSGSSASSWLASPTLSEQVEQQSELRGTFTGDEHLTVLKSAAASTHFFFICPYVCVLETVELRIENINEYFTFSLYSNVCRSLFEKHKLMFAFLLCTRIMMNDNKINMVSVRGVFIKEIP